MAKKEDLKDWVHEALIALGGKATIVAIARHIWLRHEPELRASEELFFTWQYDMRWAANSLRRENILKGVAVSRRGLWELR